ncbi:hypothetical protein Fcan01_23000 [Folsomia candida]|uniref:Uncharacterized protein n=1 Tax=Folsomia candida TaxID=158441 RepID=A0A226DB84_FOLCA|nr:hypothetical protein Fcan01_23000 [Folsomia candida]
MIRSLISQNNVEGVHPSYYWYRRVANFTTISGFLAYWILQDVLTYNFFNITPIHFIRGIRRFTWWLDERGLQYYIYDAQIFSFVSCYKTRSTTAMLSALTSPFDDTIWTCLGIGFAMVVLILRIVWKKVISDSVYLVIGITVENSVLASNSINKSRLREKRHLSIGPYTIVAVWILLVGTILTNWYKTIFTMEMIVPTIYKSP